MMRAIQRFEVSLKAFITRDGKALFMREADSGLWELPGGRIDVGEEWQAHGEILAREIREELGGGVIAAVGEAAVTWTRLRPTDGVFLFIVARPAAITGEPRLSDEHSEMRWLGPTEWQGLQFPPQSGYIDAISRLWSLV